MPGGERAELAGVGGLLARVVATAMLPDVVQHRDAALLGRPADRVEQRIVGAAAGRELDADHPRVEAARDLGERIVV